MIKAKELRVGNLIDIFGSVSQVVPSDFNPEHHNHWLTVEYNEYVIKSWKPINITEEWLLNFGFEKFECYDFGISLNLVPRYGREDVSILLSGTEFWYTTRQYDGGTSDPYEPVIQVKSVHQLMNLYFALTGKELTLKP